MEYQLYFANFLNKPDLELGPKFKDDARWGHEEKVDLCKEYWNPQSNQSGCEPRNLERVIWGIAHTYITYIHYFYLPLVFRVAYPTYVSKHLTIRCEKDHHTGNYITNFFKNITELLVMCGQSSFRASLITFRSVLFYLQNETVQH